MNNLLSYLTKFCFLLSFSNLFLLLSGTWINAYVPKILQSSNYGSFSILGFEWRWIWRFFRWYQLKDVYRCVNSCSAYFAIFKYAFCTFYNYSLVCFLSTILCRYKCNWNVNHTSFCISMPYYITNSLNSSLQLFFSIHTYSLYYILDDSLQWPLATISSRNYLLVCSNAPYSRLSSSVMFVSNAYFFVS